jgi:hypothetical protein
VTRAPQSGQEIPVGQVSGGVLARMRPEQRRCRPAPRRAATSRWRQPGSLARTRRLGDNAGMARDDSWARVLRVALPILDEARPSGMLGWVPRAAPVVTQAVVGAGHWAAGRRRRALAAWTSAAGYGLVAWGLGTEAPTPAEARQNMQQNIQRLQREGVLREPGPKAPAAAGTPTPAARRLERHLARAAPLFRATDTPPVQACFHCCGDGHRRVVGPALAAAADGARDRRRSPERRDPCPLGGPGRAAAQAEDRRRVGPGRRRMGSPGCGQYRLNRCGNSRPAAATATTEHRETARHRPANPYMSPRPRSPAYVAH